MIKNVKYDTDQILISNYCNQVYTGEVLVVRGKLKHIAKDTGSFIIIILIDRQDYRFNKMNI